MANVVKDQPVQMADKMPLSFNSTVRDLIKNKSSALYELRRLELDLMVAKQNLAKKERNLLLSTDFKELKLTNEKMRTAYVNEELSDLTAEINAKKHKIASKKDDIEIINDLIRINEIEGE